MIVDTSAVVAIVLKEPGYERLLERLGIAEESGIGTPTLTETAIVLSARLQRDARSTLLRLVREASIAVVPFAEAHFNVAVDAWHRFGRGRHAAALNFGDCLSYATARLADAPLLFVGDDFSKTDISAA